MKNFYNNFTKYALNGGGELNIMFSEKIISSQFPSICNSTVYNDNGNILTNLRSVNFIQNFEDDSNASQCYYGDLCYITRDDDTVLRTENYLGQLDSKLELFNVNKFNIIETLEPKFEMVGVEDIRLVRWNGILYGIGCNRDFDPSGYCQMVMIEINEKTFSEKSRIYIKNPEGSTVEKNWVPIIDKPYHFMRWFNPMQIVKVNPETGDFEVVFEREFEMPEIDYNGHRLRGSSQIIPINDGYLAIIHVVQLTLNGRGDKSGRYLHQFLFWDKDFNLKGYSKLFNFTGNVSEFCVGLCEKNGQLYIPFSTNDATQYILRVDKDIVFDFINNLPAKYIKSLPNNEHELVFMEPTLNNVTGYARELFLNGNYSSSFINFKRAARILKKQGYNYLIDYIIHIFTGLSLGNSDGRYITELYEFQHAVTLAPDQPEAYYFIGNYYKWRGYEPLSSMYFKLAFDRVGNLLPELENMLSKDTIIFNYIKSLWFTPRYNEVEGLFKELQVKTSNDNLREIIQAELNNIERQKNQNKININYFGK